MKKLTMVPRGIKSYEIVDGKFVGNINGQNIIAEEYFCDDDGNPILKVCTGNCENCIREGCNSCIHGPNEHLDRKYFYDSDDESKQAKVLIRNLENHLMSENPNKKLCANILMDIWKLYGSTPIEEPSKDFFTNDEIAIIKMGQNYAGALAKFYFNNNDFDTTMESLSSNEQIEVLVHKLNKHWPAMLLGDEYATKQSITYATILRHIFSDTKKKPTSEIKLVVDRVSFKIRKRSGKND